MTPPHKTKSKQGREGCIYVNTYAQIAEFFGVSVSTVKVWATQYNNPPMPKSNHPNFGKYELGVIARWALLVGPMRSAKFREEWIRDRLEQSYI
ncbi:MAG: hypothetical protein IT427_16650 [Pirellulales bacterium]|nr:hypothetical protein [Pirellulales bacterium]